MALQLGIFLSLAAVPLQLGIFQAPGSGGLPLQLGIFQVPGRGGLPLQLGIFQEPGSSDVAIGQMVNMRLCVVQGRLAEFAP